MGATLVRVICYPRWPFDAETPLQVAVHDFDDIGAPLRPTFLVELHPEFL